MASVSAGCSRSRSGWRGWPWRRAAAALVTFGAVHALLLIRPALELSLFARGAALGAGLLTGAPVVAVEEGWALPAGVTPVVVTRACSATSFAAMIVALLAWQVARRHSLLCACVIALGAGVPLSLAINASRIVALAHAHRWIIPRFPEPYANFLHLATGVAVFLPALIALNVVLERHAHRPTRCR